VLVFNARTRLIIDQLALAQTALGEAQFLRSHLAPLSRVLVTILGLERWVVEDGLSIVAGILLIP